MAKGTIIIDPGHGGSAEVGGSSAGAMLEMIWDGQALVSKRPLVYLQTLMVRLRWLLKRKEILRLKTNSVRIPAELKMAE